MHDSSRAGRLAPEGAGSAAGMRSYLWPDRFAAKSVIEIGFLLAAKLEQHLRVGRRLASKINGDKGAIAGLIAGRLHQFVRFPAA
jgi:hypothetical protein